MLLGRPHHQPPGLVVAQQAVDPVDLEGQVGGDAHRGERRFLALAGLLQALPGDDRHHGGGDGEHQERHQQDGPVDGGQGDAHDHACRPTDEGQVADPFVVGLCLLELPMPLLDAGVHLGVLGVGAGRLGRLGQVALAVEDLVGHVPQAGLVDPGQRGQVTVELGTGGQVAGSQAELGAGLGRIDPGPAQHVEALGRGEGLGDVGRTIDVDHAVASALGPEDGVSGPGIGGDLEVHPRASGAQPSDQLGDQAFTLEWAHPRDHGHPSMEVQGVRSLAGLDHESFEVHPLRSALRSLTLRRKAYVCGPSDSPPGPPVGKPPCGRLRHPGVIGPAAPAWRPPPSVEPREASWDRAGGRGMMDGPLPQAGSGMPP